ncbi:MAG TPA: hypothetical protein VGK00_14885 [Anaerolineales bacterium]|jgi:hypothetical protein
MIAGSIFIVGGLAILVVIGIAVWLLRKGQNFKLSDTQPGQKPEKRGGSPANPDPLKNAAIPPVVFDEIEDLNAPFATQIEHMVRKNLKADPFLKSIRIDFTTNPDDSLEFNINGAKYASLDAIPEGRVKVIIKQAIEAYNQRA